MQSLREMYRQLKISLKNKNRKGELDYVYRRNGTNGKRGS